MSNRNASPYILGLDLDNTTAQYTEGLRTYMMARHGYSAQEMPEPSNYSFVKSGWPFATTDEFLNAHTEAVLNDNLFQDLQQYPGASAALKALKDEGVHIHVVTHRLLANGSYQKVSMDTGMWLDSNEIPYHSLTFSSRKDSVRVHSYVEDAPSNIDSIRKAGMKVFAFDQVYNREIPGDRIHSWTDDAVDKILAHKAEIGL